MAAAALVCLFSLAGRASVINDPQMGMEDAGLSDPFSSSTVLNPTNGGGVFDFYNPNPQPIISLEFSAQLAAYLNESDVEAAFACNNASTPGDPNPFFLFCNVKYFPSNGGLFITFSGTGGTQQGIPVLLATCNNDPNSPDSTSPVDCTSQGHFRITLNDNFSVTGSQGGWSNDANPTLFPTDPQLGVVSFTTATDIPEPATAILVVGALAGLAGWRRKFRRAG